MAQERADAALRGLRQFESEVRGVQAAVESGTFVTNAERECAPLRKSERALREQLAGRRPEGPGGGPWSRSADLTGAGRAAIASARAASQIKL